MQGTGNDNGDEASSVVLLYIAVPLVGDAVRKLVAERLLLPEDDDLYIVRAWSGETAKRFATN
jgi:hypothetical protein